MLPISKSMAALLYFHFAFCSFLWQVEVDENRVFIVITNIFINITKNQNRSTEG